MQNLWGKHVVAAYESAYRPYQMSLKRPLLNI